MDFCRNSMYFRCVVMGGHRVVMGSHRVVMYSRCAVLGGQCIVVIPGML